MKSNAMPDKWGPPAKNWLKQRAGLLLNDTALQLVFAEAVRQRPDPKPKTGGGQPTSALTGSSHTRTTRSGFSSQALRLADEPLDSYDPRIVATNKKIGVAFRDERKLFIVELTHQASRVWEDVAFEYLHWLRLEFLLDMTPDKRRELPISEWIPSWPEPQRTEALTEYTRLEVLLHRYDDPVARNEEKKGWKERERTLFRALWESGANKQWNHQTLTATLVLMSLRKKGTLTYWNPWDFAGALQYHSVPKLSATEQSQLDEWMEGCATGKYDPNDQNALEMFLSTFH